MYICDEQAQPSGYDEQNGDEACVEKGQTDGDLEPVRTEGENKASKGFKSDATKPHAKELPKEAPVRAWPEGPNRRGAEGI